MQDFSAAKTETTDVLIVGGGISGLSAAHLLLRHDTPFLLAERHPGTSIHPRARGFDVRTMEIYRTLGLAASIREAGLALSPSWGIRSGSSLAAALARVKPRKGQAITSPLAMKGMESVAAQSPESGARCTQDLAEPVLLEAARRRGADIRFQTELSWFEQDEEGVTAGLSDRDTGMVYQVRARYLIAADGAGSGIRTHLGLPMEGKGALGNLLNIYFEADLGAFVRGREFSLIRISQPGIRGLLTAINNRDRWVFHLHREDVTCDPDPGQLQEILHKVLGLDGVPVRILSVLPWQPTFRVACRMQENRVFLAGDAAHIMTPYGGKGANSGVRDVHNLAWKLALVCRGKASARLLESYDAERRPIGRLHAENSARMADEHGLLKSFSPGMFWNFLSVLTISRLGLVRWFPGIPVRKLGNLMGLPVYRYRSGAVLEENGRALGIGPLSCFLGEPGTRLPHGWVYDGAREVSTLDVAPGRFALFTAGAAARWREAAARATDHFGIRVLVYSLGETGDLRAPGTARLFGLSPGGALLVRPDDYVAWRTREMPFDPSLALRSALARILDKPD